MWLKMRVALGVPWVPHSSLHIDQMMMLGMVAIAADHAGNVSEVLFANRRPFGFHP